MFLQPLDLAKRFWIDDIANASIAGTRLNKILLMLDQGRPITVLGKQFLVDRGLLVLANLANGEITEDQFQKLARLERDLRISAAPALQLMNGARIKADADAAKEREAAMWARLDDERAKRESDPIFIAKQKNRELRRKYGVDIFVEDHDFKQLMTILRKLDARSRLSDEEAVWLRIDGGDYDSTEIQHAFHRIEADFYIGEYKRTDDIWKAVSASSHLRKCDASKEAHTLLSAISDNRLKQKKLKSAVRTTHGGVLRDLGQHNEALEFGEEAHSLLPDDFRPCTLMGALNIELGQIDVGHDWYRKAEARGAPPDSIDSELRSLITRMAPEKREEVTRQLLGIDPVRYAWLRKKAVNRGKSLA
jgi:hypothetical protein